LVSAACGAEKSAPSTSSPALEQTSAAVVYGDDSRLDWYAVEDESLRDFARGASAAMIDWDSVQVAASGDVSLDTRFTLQQTENLCSDQLFLTQPTTASCSGTLIDDDLVITAAHCAGSLSDCASSAWVFDFLYEGDGDLAVVSADDVYSCVDVVVNGPVDLPGFHDIAVVQLDRPVTGRAPAIVAPQTTLTQGTPLLMLGYPSGLPLKVDEGGHVQQPRTSAGDYFVASVDSFAGNSGSGVFGADRQLLGVLTDGAADYERRGNCNIVNVLDEADAEESVMYAYWAISAVCDKGYPSLPLCGDDTPTCGDGFCTDGETLESCEQDCSGGLLAVPAEWRCNPAWYGVGDDCDCACGAYDPDCDIPQLDVLNCAP
ncbi:MAG: trypsin-like peptidase domain-containing protein, partial [Myxococcales bacterium]|nr:trypsin-like peptidase domain-containing protein [Myxococcales bacterium]